MIALLSRNADNADKVFKHLKSNYLFLNHEHTQLKDSKYQYITNCIILKYCSCVREIYLYIILAFVLYLSHLSVSYYHSHFSFVSACILMTS